MPHKARTNAARPATTRHDIERGSAASRGYGYQWRELRQTFLRRNPLCIECLREGRTEPATDVDHIIAKRLGGRDEWANLQALCHSHHSRKTAAERADG